MRVQVKARIVAWVGCAVFFGCAGYASHAQASIDPMGFLLEDAGVPQPDQSDDDGASTIYLPMLLHKGGRGGPPVIVTALPSASPTQVATATPVATASPGRSPTPTATETLDETAAFYDPDVVHDVRIELPEADWEILRHQSRSLQDIFSEEECSSRPPPSPFTYFSGTVWVNGRKLENVGVRKKGLLGSVNAVKPSLKIKFNEYEPDQRMYGMRRMTLNNAIVDPSLVRQCLTYDLFRTAGVIAPRCSFARVRVNGRSMGLFVNLESIKKPFIGRHFENKDGNLYEGTRSDFRRDWANTFEAKTNSKTNDRSDIAALVEALEADDAELIERVEELIDLNAFLRFWAMEVLTSHWDSYSNNRNNFYVYHDPQSEKMYFIPWGTDGAMRTDFISGSSSPSSVSARSHLARRLYLHPEGRRRYLRTMEDLLEFVWDEPAILAEIDRMAMRLRPYVSASERQGHQNDLNNLRNHIRGRRAPIERELAAGGADWNFPESIPPCRWRIGTLRLDFQAAWGGAVSRNAQASFTDMEGRETALENIQISVDDEVFRTWPLYPTITMDASFSEDTELFERGRRMVVYLFVERSLFAPGSVPIDGAQGQAWVYRQPRSPKNIFPGMLWEGALQIEEAHAVPGQRVAGSLETGVWLWRKDPAEP